MDRTLLLYPSSLMILLTLFLYVKNYLDNVKAAKSQKIKFGYFKVYKGDVPDYIALSRQTLKNQFELPVIFYFLVAMQSAYNNLDFIALLLSWTFVLSRYMHCYIRLTSNYVPYRASLFKVGLLALFAWWIYFVIVTVF